MKRGLVLGKFMPLHKGHMALIDFALDGCDELIVLVSASYDEPIPGSKRLEWIEQTYKYNNKIKPLLLIYDEAVLPNTSTSSEWVSKLWANYLKEYLPPIDVIFASEAYAAFIGRFLDCAHVIFDESRKIVPVSATEIRKAPFIYWDFIPEEIRSYYTLKICLYGTESTGKTTLAQRLAGHFNTVAVPEMAREILQHTHECTREHLLQIAELHARTINKKIKEANKLLFVDTDINITRSYSKFLFNEELVVPEWIVEANKFDLHLYLDTDAPYIQDGTRLNEAEKNALNESHQQELRGRGINYFLIKGADWDDRFKNAVKVVNQFIKVSRE